MHKDPLDDFDTSHWQPKDPVWMAERETQWREIEKLLFERNTVSYTHLTLPTSDLV